jgi:hypothetical protein
MVAHHQPDKQRLPRRGRGARLLRLGEGHLDGLFWTRRE